MPSCFVGNLRVTIVQAADLKPTEFSTRHGDLSPNME
uniref:Uncharacterized protein n=1 Tax=Tetranychus urticae TaxID=32264 RepID=T1KNI2_TETUR